MFEEMMKGIANQSAKTPISGNEREAVRAAMVHIPDLKEGDKVRWKKSMKDSKFPEYDQVVEVCRVFPVRPWPQSGSNHDCDENDFSAVVMQNNCINEYAFDSRRFERVTVTAE
jgi:hypothetical protein